MELAALESLKNRCHHVISVDIDPIFFKLAGNKDMHNIMNEFEFRPDRTTDYGVSCPWASKKYPYRPYNGENGVSTFSLLVLIGSFWYFHVTRTSIKAWMSLNFLKWDLTLAHCTQVSDRCPLGYLFLFLSKLYSWFKYLPWLDRRSRQQQYLVERHWSVDLRRRRKKTRMRNRKRRLFHQRERKVSLQRSEWWIAHIYCKKPIKIQTPEKIAVIILKFEQSGFNIVKCIEKMQTEWQTVKSLIRLLRISLMFSQTENLRFYVIQRIVLEKGWWKT